MFKVVPSKTIVLLTTSTGHKDLKIQQIVCPYKIYLNNNVDKFVKTAFMDRIHEYKKPSSAIELLAHFSAKLG